MAWTNSNQIPEYLRYGFSVRGIAIDPLSGKLSGPARNLRIDPKCMQVLVLLAAAPGKLVSRTDLIDGAWPDRVVGDDSLTQTVSKLRRALSDASGQDDGYHLIETLPKRGYSLTTNVTPNQPAVVISSRVVPRGALSIGAALWAIAVLAWFGLHDIRQHVHSSEKTLAVLPFRDFSAEQNRAHLAQGLSDELIGELSADPQFIVTARSSSFRFTEDELDTADVARSLGVRYLIEGSLHEAKEQYRISVRLVDAQAQQTLWSRQFQGSMGDFQRLKTEIATGLAGPLEIELSQTTDDAQFDPLAYDHYLKGQFFMGRRGDGDLERSQRQFELALDHDPRLSKAWAGLGGALSIRLYGMSEQTALLKDRVQEALNRALALDPDLPEAHARAADYYFLEGDMETSEWHWDRALSLGQGKPLVLSKTAGRALFEGRYERALELMDLVVQLDPLSAVQQMNRGLMLLAAGSAEAAEASILHAIELNPEFAESFQVDLAFVYILQERFEDAVMLAMPADATPGRDLALALANHGLGRTDDVLFALQRLHASDAGLAAFRLAEWKAVNADHDEAFVWLERIRELSTPEERKRAWPPWSMRLLASPFLGELHNDERWQSVLTGLDFDRPEIAAVAAN